MSCVASPYTLPSIEFVGGSIQDLRFHVYFHTHQNPFDLSRCTANFAIVGFTNKRGSTILSKAMTIERTGIIVDGGMVYNMLTVQLTSAETVALEGKYIYQISIKENTGKVEVPSQGVLYITNNINKRYITG